MSQIIPPIVANHVTSHFVKNYTCGTPLIHHIALLQDRQQDLWKTLFIISSHQGQCGMITIQNQVPKPFYLLQYY